MKQSNINALYVAFLNGLFVLIALSRSEFNKPLTILNALVCLVLIASVLWDEESLK